MTFTTGIYNNDRHFILSILCIFSLLFEGYGQPYGNEWIDFSKTYYKFPVTADGLYRVTYSSLINSNIPVASINPNNITIFNRGQPVYLFIAGGDDNSFDSGDYIEFYCRKNDGFLDKGLYADPAWQPNENYSLFNDTAFYFFTWGDNPSSEKYVVESDTIFQNYTPASFILKESRSDYTGKYWGGQYTASGVYDSRYTEGEGWYGAAFSSPVSETIPTGNAFTGAGAPSAKVAIGLVGANLSGHLVNLKFGNVDTTPFFTGVRVNKFVFSIPSSSLDIANTQFLFTPQGDYPDYNALAYISVKYPHNFNLENNSSYRFFLPDQPVQTKSYLIFSNFNGSTAPVLYDLTIHKRIQVVKNLSSYHALVPNSGSEKECVISSTASIPVIPFLWRVGPTGKFTDYKDSLTNFTYLILTHRSLAISAEEYKNYRSSQDGGGYNPLIVDVEELYDQFSYGIRKHPLGIRNFAGFVLNQWDSVPKAMLLLGKAIYSLDNNGVEVCRNNPGFYAANLVPTFGYPPSDNLLTAGLIGTLYEPAIPTGRLAARTPQEVADYLDKVTEYEAVSQDPDEWMKKVMHFGGGKVIQEQETIKNILVDYESIIEDTNFGGMVYSYLKTSSDPIQPDIANSAVELINNGVSIMTFAGHSSQSGFDINIESPEQYSNRDGKYPVLMAIGCFVGNIHSTNSSFSEQWVLHQNGGSIAFFASTSLGELSPLSIYLRNVYISLGQSFYGSSFGKIIQEAIRASQLNYNTESYIRSYQDMTLHGDPVVVIHSPLLPDLSITQKDIFFSPSYVTTEMNNFNMKLIITNTGRAIKKEFPVDVIRQLPLLNNPLAPVVKFHPQSLFKDTVTISFPVDPIYGVGLNSFDVEVNHGDYVKEKTHINNSATAFLFIRSDDVVPVYPPEYAIIPKSTVTLNASTGNPFAGIRNYFFQMDTNNTFTLPLATQTVTQAGGVIKWTPPLVLTDSTVYFWRVKWDSSQTWRGSSFEFIKDKYGWGQSHFNQFAKDEYRFIVRDSILRTFNFVPAKRRLFCRTIGNASASQLNDTRYFIDMTWGDYSGCCPSPSLIVAVIDSLTLEPWQAPWKNTNTDHNFNQVNGEYCVCPPWNRPESYFIYWTGTSNDQSRSDLANMLVNSIPNGNYVLVYSLINPNISYWKSDLIQAFGLLGADTFQLKSIPNSNPFIFLCKKGDSGYSPILVWGDTPTATLILDTVIESQWSYGSIITPVIGPANTWQSLHWRVASAGTNDKVILRVAGISTDGSTDFINGIDSIDVSTPDILNLSNFVNAGSYPYLKVSLNLQDDLLKTPAQIKSWRILFEGVPEAAINPALFHSFFDDTLQEGTVLQCTTAVQNISYYNLDSLRVRWWITDPGNNNTGLTYKIFKPLQPNDTLHTWFSYYTLGLSGNNSLWIEINPKDSLWQREQSHFNNIAQLPFYVLSDKINPILDVTFDGIHILNGDIISAVPDILIQLKDENKYLVLNDSNLFELYLKNPGATVETYIPFDGTVLKFIPASLPENKARVEYRPQFTIDGTYELRVRGKDVTKNRSGDFDYVITFQIITRSTITYFLNWPNPFSTKTHFVFTLTGSVIPDGIRIQILTISGKVVREIFEDELGPLKIGKNITDFTWDGTDQFGDRLANGVYLYKVTARLFGEEIEHRKTDADQYFHKGFGKMFLMR